MALDRLARAATTTDNLMPLILESVKASATVGEISNVLRAAWGEHVETLVI
jgi:methylmalonyl-CoA mutase N-terminal domain/subunit